MGKLTGYARNPRKNDHVVDKMVEAINEFGFRIPIIAKSDGTVVDGHLRLKAAVQMGISEVPVALADDLSDAQVKAFRLLANRSVTWADWDDELLALELGELQDLNFDLALTGFSELELSGFLAEQTEGLTDPEDVPDVPDAPVTVLGDVWLLGRHRVMCGDSTSIDAVELLMGGHKADMVFTDPPYNIDYGNIKHPKSKVRQIENDNMSGEDFKDFCASFVACIKAACNGCVYVFGHPGPDGRIMFTELDAVLHCSTTIVWNKDAFTLGRGKYQNKYEPCWFGWNDSGAAFINDRKLTNVWDFPRPRDSKLHPTMKPVAIVENAIGHASNVGGTVLDLFGGSGTTAIACEKTARDCRMMELDPKYCDVIITRWQNFTGQQATLESTGQTFTEISAQRLQEAA